MSYGQELAQRHPRGAGDERRDRADEADEAADQDRHPAAALEEALDVLEALLGDLHARAVADHEVAAEPAAEHVGGEVAGDGAGPDDRDQDGERDHALARDEAADDDRRLARRDQPDERAGLEEGHDADRQVGPLAERLAGLLDQVLDVRELDHARADQARADRGERADDERHAAVVAAADDQVERERDGACEPDGVHQTGCGSAYARPTGSAASAPGWRSASDAAAARACAGPSSPVKRPTTVGPEPDTIARTAPAERTAASASPIAGQSERAGASRSLCSRRSASSEDSCAAPGTWPLRRSSSSPSRPRPRRSNSA